MRTLCIVPKNPLPPDNGGRQRMVALLDAWRTRGPIDIVVTAPLQPADEERIAQRFDARVHSVDSMGRHRRGRLRWLQQRTMPRSLALLDPAAAKAEVRRFIAAAPDEHGLVWCEGAAAMFLFGKLRRDIPVVIDFADVTWVLHDRAARVAAGASDRYAPARFLRRGLLGVDRSRALRFERHQAGLAHLVTVCSDVDREALGVPGAVVVPNGFARPPRPLGRVTVGEPPVLLFQGQMTYGPNVDGARWFVHEVLPRLRSRIPDITVELAGRASRPVLELGSQPGVSVLGYVEDLDPVLARADAVIVPLRQGSGTRVKIIEAFAHRIPVVSTTIGAEGLGVEDGVEVLIGDDPARFAEAVVRVIQDHKAREVLVERAAERHDEELDWEVIIAALLDRVDRVMSIAERYEPRGAM